MPGQERKHEKSAGSSSRRHQSRRGDPNNTQQPPVHQPSNTPCMQPSSTGGMLPGYNQEYADMGENDGMQSTGYPGTGTNESNTASVVAPQHGIDSAQADRYPEPGQWAPEACADGSESRATHSAAAETSSIQPSRQYTYGNLSVQANADSDRSSSTLSNQPYMDQASAGSMMDVSRPLWGGGSRDQRHTERAETFRRVGLNFPTAAQPSGSGAANSASAEGLQRPHNQQETSSFQQQAGAPTKSQPNANMGSNADPNAGEDPRYNWDEKWRGGR